MELRSKIYITPPKMFISPNKTKMMRVVAAAAALVAIYLFHHQGVLAANINIFYYDNGLVPNATAYGELMDALRDRLGSGNVSHGIRVLRRPEDVEESPDRFILVQLVNGLGNNITVAIDVGNVYLVGYLAGNTNTFYTFPDTPPQANCSLFLHATRSSLGFNSSYQEIEKAANRRREQCNIGHTNVNQAINNLYYSTTSIPSSLLVIIQVISEAARFPSIEWEVLRAMDYTGESFTLPNRLLSIETRWSQISEQIQRAGDDQFFQAEIQFGAYCIRNIHDLYFLGLVVGLALYRPPPCQRFHTGSRSDITLLTTYQSHNEIRMEDTECVPNSVMATANIVGPGELCVEVSNGWFNNNNPIQLWTCGGPDQANQLWEFRSDGTIRCMGKCLTTYSSDSGPSVIGANIVIYDCDGNPIHRQWAISSLGTIINSPTGLVVEASNPTPYTILTLARDYNTSRQAWAFRNYTDQSTIANLIMGFQDMCLGANDTILYTATCNVYDANQYWALFSDSTIRASYNSRLCVTSSVQGIGITQCGGCASQRWAFMANGAILNPSAGLVMEARGGQVVLNKPTGNLYQQWEVIRNPNS